MENDVKLLRNRVRMLQLEHEKAQKKIDETAKRAEKFEQLKIQNNQKYLQDLAEREKRAHDAVRTSSGVPYAEVRRQ